jgi:hypothetical protein
MLRADGSVNLIWCGFTQAGARIHELERAPCNWKIEHSPFTDEFGFRSFRIVQKAAQMALTGLYAVLDHTEESAGRAV